MSSTGLAVPTSTIGGRDPSPSPSARSLVHFLQPDVPTIATLGDASRKEPGTDPASNLANASENGTELQKRDNYLYDEETGLYCYGDPQAQGSSYNYAAEITYLGAGTLLAGVGVISCAASVHRGNKQDKRDADLKSEAAAIAARERQLFELTGAHTSTTGGASHQSG